MLPTHLFNDPDVLHEANGSNASYMCYTGMESFNSNDSIDNEHPLALMYPYFGYSSFSSRKFEFNVSELTSSMQGFSIDVAGIERELRTSGKRDTDLIRQDFIRNGIESSISERGILCTRHQAGFGTNSLWPKDTSIGMNNQSFSACPTVDDAEEQLRAFDSTHKQSRRRRVQKENDFCVFCYNNHEAEETYLGHTCRDVNGLVMCPRLMKYVCPYCKATGIHAHTKKYCPKKPIITPADLEKMVLDKGLQPKERAGHDKAAVTRDKKVLRF
ncbi:uncharacterized protein LOC131691311 [Topomyia yanbarensis]|uniref:uncharacterized protein LOC131691311 n=1 Tax=Topomyia yanbarensis TaxID=2498891 RepID=UPI00273AF9A4|nr:uncharacterized protein LOC131691311 [Topomyia yanbarensis]